MGNSFPGIPEGLFPQGLLDELQYLGGVTSLSVCTSELSQKRHTPPHRQGRNPAARSDQASQEGTLQGWAKGLRTAYALL